MEQDEKQALSWYQQGAALGDVQCYQRLGVFAAEGIAGEKNLEEARKWLNVAVDAGDEQAEELLAWYGLE